MSAAELIDYEPVIVNVQNQIARLAGINVSPTVVIMNSVHYRHLQAEAHFSTIKTNDDADSVCGLPIVITNTLDVRVCASPTELSKAGLL